MKIIHKCSDLEAQPSLEPEDNEQDNEDEDEESFPLLQETKFDGSLQHQQSGAITGPKSLRRQSRSDVNVRRRKFSLNILEC